MALTKIELAGLDPADEVTINGTTYRKVEERKPEIPWDKMPEGTLVEMERYDRWHTRLLHSYTAAARLRFYDDQGAYKAARPAPMPWLVHTGGECPVHVNQEVEVIVRGNPDQPLRGLALNFHNWGWSTADPELDIIAFKVVLD